MQRSTRGRKKTTNYEDVDSFIRSVIEKIVSDQYVNRKVPTDVEIHTAALNSGEHLPTRSLRWFFGLLRCLGYRALNR